MSLEKKLDLHIEEDRGNFEHLTDRCSRIEKKQDVTNSKLDELLGQWKLARALFAGFVGFVGGLLGAWLS